MMEMIKVALVAAALLVLFCYVIVFVKRRRKSKDESNLYSSRSSNNHQHQAPESPAMTSPLLRRSPSLSDWLTSPPASSPHH
jgi:hypothetical protein